MILNNEIMFMQHNKDHPMPEKICKDGFRNYGTNRGVVIIPNKEVHPLNSTVRTSSALSLMENKKDPDPEIVFKGKCLIQLLPWGKTYIIIY